VRNRFVYFAEHALKSPSSEASIDILEANVSLLLETALLIDNGPTITLTLLAKVLAQALVSLVALDHACVASCTAERLSTMCRRYQV
jgi:hypothetical protein